MTRHTSAFSKDFILMAIGQIISLFGNQILRFALPLYLLNQTGSSALFGTISAISFIPMILLFPIGGIIADRVNKRNIMVILDFVISNTCGYHPYYLNRIFKLCKGCPIHQYIINHRLSIAVDLLLSTDYGISEIAQKSGFNSQISFIRAFKKQYHLTPTEFRKKTL